MKQLRLDFSILSIKKFVSSSELNSLFKRHSLAVEISKFSNSLIRDCDPMDPSGLDATMRSSFYSTRNGGFNA